MNAPPPTTRDVLTQVEATQRAARVTEAAYEIDLKLQRGAATYHGDVTATFTLTGTDAVFLDFTGKRIDSLQVNGETIAEPNWTGYRLTLDAGLRDGANTVRVVYENDYDHTGDGFHQFVDPEDGEEYLYTNFEPYSAHRLFPSFDQPDIKATYQLTVSAPADWTLIANSNATATEDIGDGLTRHTFEQTRPFSTYLFALIAGPYEAFRDQHGDIPLGFFARKSLTPYIDQEELFQVTKQGLDFFQAFFDYPYPFTKYDQIFVPEFNAGAMENVAAVTHSERLVFRDPPTDNDRLGRAEVLLHEMAHMWFGNLVTMRWWNDLWLNESFATYMAYLALVEGTRFTHAWQSFNSGMKNWAYRQDQLITTHPIAGEVADTDATFLNFDGITYGKGAAVIKQLVAAMGMEGFREGMRLYFQTHAFSNTTLSDWLDSLGEGVGRDLHGWAALWLETASLNTLSATTEVADGRIQSMHLRQSALEDYPTLRPHQVEIALVRDDGDSIVIDAVPAYIEDAEATVEGAAGRPAPALVYPNYNDHAFAKLALDEPSLEFIRERLDHLDDTLLRQLIWQTLWHMVRDQQLKSTDYLELAGPKAVTERDHELVETILQQMIATVSRYVPEAQKAAAAHGLFELSMQALETVDDPDLQIIWARTLVNVAINPDDIRTTAQLADGGLTIPGLVIDQDMRWTIALHHVAYGLEGADERVATERERDPSDRGQRAMLRCETSHADLVVKEAAWERFHGEGYGSLHLTGAAMGGFHWWSQRDLLAPYIERYFEQLPRIFEERDNEFASTYFSGLWPGYAVDRTHLDRANTLLGSIGDRLPVLQRRLREAIDDLERAIKCREFAEQ